MAGKSKDSTKKKGGADALLEKVGGLTKVQRLLVWLVALGLIGAGFYFLLIGPKLDALNAARRDLETQKEVLEKYKRQAAELEKVEARMARAQEQFSVAMAALPDKREVPSLLDEISRAGRDAGLEVQLFAPQNEVKKNFYIEIPLSMKVAGRYHQMAEFFYLVAGFKRIVNMSTIDMKYTPGKGAGDKKKVQMECKAVTYRFVEAKENDAGADDKGKKKKRTKR